MAYKEQIFKQLAYYRDWKLIFLKRCKVLICREIQKPHKNYTFLALWFSQDRI